MALEYKHKDNNNNKSINKDSDNYKEGFEALEKYIKDGFNEIRTKHKTKLKGKARGSDTEWENFIKKNPKADISLIEKMELGAKNYYVSESRKSDADNPFRYTQNFSTWINQKSWEMYLPDNAK